MVSDRIKYARAHLSRRKHIALLAKPLWRRVQTTDANCLPRPFSVSRAALRARPNKRIKMMAQPKTSGKKLERSQSRASLQYPRTQQEERTEPSKRLLDLALPKKTQLVHTRMYGLALGNRHMLKKVNSLLRGLSKSKYQKYRVICNTLHQRAAAREKKIRRKLHRALSKPGDWERHKRVLERLAAPRLPPKPALPDRGKAGTVDKARLDLLAEPARKRASPGPDPYRVRNSALVYEITERVAKLSVREHPREEPPYNVPGQVVPEALRAVASKRTQKLAEPAMRPRGLETDLKKDAFSVLARALRAVCSPRIKKLAKPKHRVKLIRR